MPEQARRRDQPVPDAPATVPRPDEGLVPGAPRPSEDGGVDQHPIHDSDVEDLGPEDYEEDDGTRSLIAMRHQDGALPPLEKGRVGVGII